MGAEALAPLLTPRLTNFNRAEPISVKQHAGLLLDHVDDVLFGGAAGGGKSSWLLHAAVQYADVEGYAAIIFRRTYKQLESPGGLMDRSKRWWGGTGATWSEDRKTWTFPGGGRLKFGHLDGKNEWMDHQGPEYQFVGFDELTQFREWDFRYLFSRLRRPKVDEARGEDEARIALGLSKVPLRMRAASNPGGPGHEWVKRRYGLYVPEGDDDPRRLCERPEWVRKNGRVFIPAKIRDNPGLDVDSYIKSLSHLDPTTLSQLMDGDWDVREPGELFQRAWFKFADHAPDGVKWVRFWDLAATEESATNNDPDWTAGVKVGRHPNGSWWIGDVRHVRKRPKGVEELMAATAELDGLGVPVRWEQEPGASGKAYSDHLARNVLWRYDAKGVSPTGDKVTRAKPVSTKAELGLIHLIRADWNNKYLDEHEAFPVDEGGHDDMVDATSGGVQAHATGAEVTTESYRPSTQEPVVQRGDMRLVGERYVDKE